ncbi:MAG: hypothetical protein K2H81_01595, partial [Alistipes sp.]|nr:hypothetical protein [Alistipes sp.]
FIYTCIKVKLTEGEKEMAAPKPSRTITANFLFWLQKTQKSCSQNRHDSSPCQDTKANQKICESISDFATRIGEIITDMPYLCELEVSEQKRAIFLFFPSFEDKLRLKVLNLRFLTKKQVNFRAVYLLIHKLLIINWHNMLHR